MNPDEIFKRFFGIYLPQLDDRPFRPAEDKSGNGWPGEKDHEANLFHDWHNQMHRQFQMMDEEIEKLFHFWQLPDTSTFAGPELPAEWSETHPGPRTSNGSPGSSARAQVLKEGMDGPRSSQSPEQPSMPNTGAVIFPSLLEEFFGTPRWNRLPPEERRDTELDGKTLDTQEIVDMLERPNTPNPPSPFSYGSEWKTFDSHTVLVVDGVIEEKHITRDSSGREETTVTRRLGDSSHTVTTIKDKGQEENREVFHNVDKDAMLKLDKHRQDQGNSSGSVFTDTKTALQLPMPTGGIFSDTKGFFRKFFGF